MVADLRAPTPTAAAEMAVPVKKDLINSLNNLSIRIKKYISNRLEFETRSLFLLDKAIPSITSLLERYNVRYNNAKLILSVSLSSMIKIYEDNFLRKVDHLKVRILNRNLKSSQDILTSLVKKIILTASGLIDNKIHAIQLQSSMLDVLSHNSVLKRGFALVRDKNLKIIKNSKNLKHNEELMINFYRNDEITVKLKKDK